jgi:starvation-inducible DNA-binding protein
MSESKGTRRTAISPVRKTPSNVLAPPRLSTMTDLSPQEAKAIAEALNPFITDAFALYVKTKNFHKHLYDPHFRDYHLLFDELADPEGHTSPLT